MEQGEASNANKPTLRPNTVKARKAVLKAGVRRGVKNAHRSTTSATHPSMQNASENSANKINRKSRRGKKSPRQDSGRITVIADVHAPIDVERTSDEMNRSKGVRPK
ncbi:unnamed protein product [Trichogramma brassicae]|uniref:Uncharacterized protein n=1 Tax=Trichogramma brassicae TaxID=86971 RepID=A0A6H5I3T5_9HYME|nr:unnamed protein product [Trichogramma brassicae]